MSGAVKPHRSGIEGGLTMKIENLKKQDDGRWTWTVYGVAYATNQAGNGMFTSDEYGFYNVQTVGTCDFRACETVSGMRRKLKEWFSED
jgi:hypothetical protein